MFDPRLTKVVCESYALGTYIIVFQAEVFAVLSVARKDEVIGGPQQKIYIRCDSQAALKAICSPRTRSALVQECGDALEELSRIKEVRLIWVSGHSGIPGNKRADELARLGVEGTYMRPEPALGITRQQVTSALMNGLIRH